MASWASVKSLAIFFGPILIPRAIAYYRTVRAAPKTAGLAIRPVPEQAQRALTLLFGAAVILLLSTFPFFAPENVFSLTKTRIQASTDVLFTRLSQLRPDGFLTPGDIDLRTKLASLESRLLFFKFGPDVVGECAFCNADEPMTYFYYSLAAILWSHLLNMCVVAVATSGIISGAEGARWRSQATIAAVALAGLDIYFVYSYDYRENARATRLEDVRPFFWDMRIYRHLMLAAVDALLGWVIYLSSTNRAFGNPPSAAERIETLTRQLEVAKSKMNATGIVRNSVIRDEPLRTRSNVYWAHEVALMGQVMEEREVVEGVKNALESRIDIARISADAEAYAQNVLGPEPAQ